MFSLLLRIQIRRMCYRKGWEPLLGDCMAIEMDFSCYLVGVFLKSGIGANAAEERGLEMVTLI